MVTLLGRGGNTDVLKYMLRKLLRAASRRTARGAVNDIIDALLHPWFGKTCGLAEILDFILHCANEGEVSLEKFVRYNMRSFVSSVLEAIRRVRRDE